MGKLLLPRRSLLAAPAIIMAERALAQPFSSALTFGKPASGASCTHDADFTDVGLLCHFDQANGATTFVDSSNNAQSVLGSSGARASTAQAKFGTASLNPNGGNTAPGGAYSSYEFGSGAFTIEAQVYFDGTSASNNPGIVCFWPGFSGTELWRLVWNRGSSPATLSFSWSTDGTNVANTVATSGAFSPATNTWVSVAVDRSGNTFRLYVDGSVVATATASDTIYGSPSFGTPNIGNWGNSSGNTWTGYIDEVRVTKGVARYAGAYTPAGCAFPNST